MSSKSSFPRFTRLLCCSLLTLLSVSPLTPLQAGTIVRFSTTMGDFSVELLDEAAPQTVANFLSYVVRNDYNGTYLHRVVNDFVVQGGGYRFQPFVGPVDVPSDPPVVNEYNTSNVRGTLAMAKLPGDENSATNQWYVNLDDNTELDTDNGGYTVFGNVLGEGMVVMDAIDDLPVVELGTKAPSAPYFTESYNSDPGNFVYVNIEVVDRFSSAPHVFENSRGLLITSVSVNNGEELWSLNMNLVSDSPDPVLQVNMESLIPRQSTYEGIATYSTADEKLRIPTLEVNDRGNVRLINNVVLARSSSNAQQFILESYEE